MISAVIIGAGDRGTMYATFADAHPDRLRIVGVAEPRAEYRERMAARYGFPADQVFSDWTDALDRPRFADAIVIATHDRAHAGPAIAAAERGYNILLEKPMAVTEADCRKIVAAVEKAGVLLSVCHPYRYTEHTRLLREIVDSGSIGDIASIQHLEPVGYWHQAHSFVRGNWRNEGESAFMLLAKSCHDLDWLRYMMGESCTSVSSFGSLMHFTEENRPEGAADRCLDCAVERDCPYSAKRIYLDAVIAGKTDWPVDVLTPDPSAEAVESALRNGPYGRCVYTCDNDVVDHQVVNFEFASGATANFTMTAFTDTGHRKTHIFGTRGHLYGDGDEIRHFDFLSNRTTVIPVAQPPVPVMTGHGGGDYRVMDHFVRAVDENDPTWILSGPQETLESHLMAFAAERSRLERRVVDVLLDFH
jgi:predicted dehydrogenase